jgi:hypothetical protein
MQALALATAAAIVGVGAVAMRWGGDLRRLGDAAIAALRGQPRRRGWLGMAVVLEAAARPWGVQAVSPSCSEGA